MLCSKFRGLLGFLDFYRRIEVCFRNVLQSEIQWLERRQGFFLHLIVRIGGDGLSWLDRSWPLDCYFVGSWWQAHGIRNSNPRFGVVCKFDRSQWDDTHTHCYWYVMSCCHAVISIKIHVTCFFVGQFFRLTFRYSGGQQHGFFWRGESGAWTARNLHHDFLRFDDLPLGSSRFDSSLWWWGGAQPTQLREWRWMMLDGFFHSFCHEKRATVYDPVMWGLFHKPL